MSYKYMSLVENETQQVFCVLNRSELAPDFGFFDNVDDRNLAIDSLRHNMPVVGEMSGVFGFFCGSNQQEVRNKILKYKDQVGEDRKFSLLMPIEHIIDLIDKDQLHPEIRKYFANSAIFDRTFGGLVHMRVPITKQVAESLPSYIVSQENNSYYIQNISPYGHKGICEFANEVIKNGLGYPMVATFNIHGQAEPTNLDGVTSQWRKMGCPSEIGLVLSDSTPIRKDMIGSFLILNAKTLEVHRDGRYPYNLLHYLTGIPKELFDISNMKPSQYEQLSFEEILELSKWHVRTVPQIIRAISLGEISLSK